MAPVPSRRLLPWVAALAALLLCAPALAGQVVVDFLDIGQGDAILVRGAGKTVLIDAGDRGASTVEQLQALGVERIDLLVSSHPHADHIGTMADVLQAFPVGLLLDNGMTHTTATYERLMRTAEELEVPYRTAEPGMRLNLGDIATFTVLFPPEELLRGTRSDLNSNSVVLRLDHGEVSFLFTGDAEAPTEQALVDAGIEPVVVLKVAHHGSDHSSTVPFLEAVRPKYAVIQAGRNNRYGHPGAGTLERLQAVGALVYRNDLSHHIRAVSDGRTVELFEGTLSELGTGIEPPRPASGSRARAHDDEMSPRKQRRLERRENRRRAREARSR